MNVVDNLNSVQVINKPCVCSSTMRLSTFCGLHRDTEQILLFDLNIAYNAVFSINHSILYDFKTFCEAQMNLTKFCKLTLWCPRYYLVNFSLNVLERLLLCEKIPCKKSSLNILNCNQDIDDLKSLVFITVHGCVQISRLSLKVYEINPFDCFLFFTVHNNSVMT